MVFEWLKKKAPTYPEESRWSVHRGEHDGKPMYLRRNDSAKQLARHPDFRFRIGVAIPLKAADEHGLPAAGESDELGVIEDALASRLEAGQRSLHVLAITTAGMRELVFYTRDPSAMQPAVEAVRAEVHSHELQSYLAEDPNWELFEQFA